jgi:hypothetical protein
MYSFRNRIYYILKPFIPRRFQIALRRKIILEKRLACANIWPIDQEANKQPYGWPGWPDGKKFALVLTHDVDTAKGQEKCITLAELEGRLGLRSSFNFVAEKYQLSPGLREYLTGKGFEVGVHGLYHDGKYYISHAGFQRRAKKINRYLKEWNATGYRSPSMQYNLDWFHNLNIEYDASTFDTDPFEPQPEGVRTIFPFYVPGKDNNQKGYVELPYTLPQDFTLFVLMQETDISIWKKKLDWVAEQGGMALVLTHPDYMNFGSTKKANEEYTAGYYKDFLNYVKSKYAGQYWHVLPKDIALYWTSLYGIK